MKTFRHVDAKTYRQATKLLQAYGSKARVMAGGTDLLGALKDKILLDYPEVIVNLKSIPGMDHIKEDGQGLRIGATARLADVAASPAVKTRYPMLAGAARAVASPQVRNMATIGGNLCQDVRCWYYRYPHSIGGRIHCYLKGEKSCYALNGENQYHSIFGGCRIADPPCTGACPGSIQIAPYLDLIRKGDLNQAAAIMLQNNPLPAVTGRVCPHWCQGDCNRQDFDLSVSIRGTERYLGDYILEHVAEVIQPPQKETGKTVAIAGSGPAGLAAAYYLRMAGHRVTVFDKMSEAGGLLTYAVPAYRLPNAVVKKSVEAIRSTGVEFQLKAAVGKDITIAGLSKDFDAVFLATGMGKARPIGLDGEELTVLGLDFLRTAKMGLEHAPGERVLVIGGGGVALDAAIAARRLGAREVTVACLECRAEMPADSSEIEQAIEEGVKFMPSWGPAKILEENGRIVGMELVCCTSVFDKEGRFCPSYDNTVRTTVAADAIILAVGQAADLSYLGDPPVLKEERGLLVVNPQSSQTALTGVYAGGDVVSGPGSVIGAIAAGRKAAAAIDQYLAGGVAQASVPVGPPPVGPVGPVGQASLPVPSLPVPPLPVPSLPVPGGFLGFDPSCLKHSEPIPQPKLVLSRRALNTEDNPGFDLPGAETEASRCFNCGCVAVSPSDIAVALTALNARVKIAGPSSTRLVTVEDFFTPAGKALGPDEIVAEIQVPQPPPGARQVFEKFRLRQAVDFPIVSVATLLTVKDGICRDAGVVLGAVAPAPLRARAAEEALKGKPVTEETAAAAAAAAVQDALPLLKNEYKVQITRTLVKRALL